MKNILPPIILLIATLSLRAQNVGINTTSPASTLSINGSFSAAYKTVTSSYTLTADDYFVVYNGAAAATFTLPPALAANSGNFKGRIYKIKNTGNGLLTIKPAANEKISTEVVALLYKGASLELINTGNTTGITWEAGAGLTTDGIRNALEQGGCASCGNYDLAALNTWVQITAGEFDKVGSALPGITTDGMRGSNVIATSAFTGSVSMTQNLYSPYQMAPSSYPVAVGFKTGPTAPLTISGMQLKLSSRNPFSGYIDYGPSLPAVSAPAAQTFYYFVNKRPTQQSLSNAPSYLAIYQSASNQVGRIATPVSSGSIIYYTNGNENSMYNTLPSVAPIFFVLSTTVKSW